MMKYKTQMWVIIALLIWCRPVWSQADSKQIITIHNVRQLQSVQTITFADGFIIPSKNPQHPEPFISVHQFDTGWFTADNQLNTFVVLDHEKTLIPVQKDRIVTYLNPLAYGEDLATTVLIDAVFIDDFLATIYYKNGVTYLTYDNLSLYGGWGGGVALGADIEAKSIWGDCPDSEDTFSCRAWLEANLLDERNQAVVMAMPTIGEVVQNFVPLQLNADSVLSLPYAPAEDPEAVVRIGRVHLPYVVTSDLTGVVKLWNIQTGELLAEVNNGVGEPSVFGNINHRATHLAWRDNANDSLYLLNFETNENHKVADLDGSYMQFMFLSSNADVILAVNLDFQPHVYAWDIASGERIDLGPYRACNRVPDMARLSADGTTLIIGCDTGLDIWQVAEF